MISKIYFRSAQLGTQTDINIPFLSTLILCYLDSMSHRERVEQFNEKLGKLTELNDIPRVSAAGNG